MVCNFDLYNSETLTWDNEIYKAWHPDTISYFIENTPGLPYKIWWDNTQSYLIQNPTDYSYQVIPYGSFTGRVKISRSNPTYSGNPITLGTVTYTGAFVSAAPYSAHYLNNDNNLCVSGTGGWTEVLAIRWRYLNISNAITTSNQSTVSWNMQNLNQWCITDIAITQNTITGYKLRIRDGTDYYNYSITNNNSVWIESTISGKKINVNGHKFDLVDENSIKLECTDPIQERCPSNTYECDCSDHYCCYTKVTHGYQLFREIKKV